MSSWKDLLRGTFPASKSRLRAEARVQRSAVPSDLHALIAQQRTELAIGARRIAKAQSARRFAELQAECNDLKLFVAAILRVLVTKELATQAEVLALVEAIDAEDGKVDGRSNTALPLRPQRHGTGDVAASRAEVSSLPSSLRLRNRRRRH